MWPLFSKVADWLQPNEETLRKRAEKRCKRLEALEKKQLDKLVKEKIRIVCRQQGFSKQEEKSFVKLMRQLAKEPHETREEIFDYFERELHRVGEEENVEVAEEAEENMAAVE